MFYKFSIPFSLNYYSLKLDLIVQARFWTLLMCFALTLATLNV